jgi:hypothetical protein
LEVENISPLYIKKEVQEKFSCRGYRGVPYTFSKSPKVWGTNRGLDNRLPNTSTRRGAGFLLPGL